MSTETAKQIAALRTELEETATGRKPVGIGRILAAGALLLSYHAEEWLEWAREITDEEQSMGRTA